MARLEGRVAIITGSASGIGSALATVFAAEGAQVVVADIDEQAGSRLASKLTTAGVKAWFGHVDVAHVASCIELAEEVVNRFGSLDIVCCNAGIYPSVTLWDMTESDWDRVHSINLKGAFLTVKACLPQMRRQSYGRVILTSSITGPITGYPGWAHYGATKAGLLGFMRTAALEVAPNRITMNAVMPGNVRTQGYAALDQDYIRETEAYIPLKRLAEPEDIAHAALFLASEEAGYITGQTLVIDGGQTLPESPLAKP